MEWSRGGWGFGGEVGSERRDEVGRWRGVGGGDEGMGLEVNCDVVFLHDRLQL